MSDPDTQPTPEAPAEAVATVEPTPQPTVVAQDSPAPAAAPEAKAPRRKRTTSLFAHGEPMVWLTGGALVIALAMIFGLFLYLHVLACLWYYVIKDTEQWLCNFDFVFGGSHYLYEVYSGSFARRYLRVFYIAFYIIAIGEMVPRRNIEILLISAIMLASAILISNIFGSMAVLAVELNAKTIKFQE